MKYILFAAASAGLLAACTSTQKVAVTEPSDYDMTCEQLSREFAELDQVMQEADKNKGVNGANVAAAVFFWPAAVGNYMDADKAQDLAEQRREHLNELYVEKGCASA